MRRMLAVGVVLLFLALPIRPSDAYVSCDYLSVSFVPASQTVGVGDLFNVGVTISGLGDQRPQSLGVFDLYINFDPSILAFNNVTFGDPVLGDQLSLSGYPSISLTKVGDGTVNLLELSLAPPSVLDGLQRRSFTLVTLAFDALAAGTSLLGWLPETVLGDASGEGLPVVLESGKVQVTPVPEPATILLLSFGIAGVGIAARRRFRQG